MRLRLPHPAWRCIAAGGHLWIGDGTTPVLTCRRCPATFDAGRWR